MKKSRERVKQFLSTFRPAGERDNLLISLFLGKRKIKLPIFSNPSLDASIRDKITFEQFESWYNADNPSAGDVIKSPDSEIVGLVTGERWNTIIAGAILASGNLRFEEHILTEREYVPASEDEVLHLQQAVAAAGYDWNQISKSFVKREVPQSARFVRLMVLGRQVGVGIFKNIMPDNTLKMFCIKMDNEPIRYDDDLCLGDADNFSFTVPYDEHRATLQNALAKYNLVWNARCQRIQKNNARAKLGKGYYWVSSYMEIKRSIESGSIGDNRRFNRGNYFLSRDVALRVRNRMFNICKEEMMAEDNL